jgi:hypothetical protein
MMKLLSSQHGQNTSWLHQSAYIPTTLKTKMKKPMIKKLPVFLSRARLRYTKPIKEKKDD